MVKSSDKAWNLSDIMDSDLSQNSHNKAVTKTVLYHLKNIAKIKGLITQQDLEKLIHAFIFSSLDYCNGVFTGLSKNKISQIATADSELFCLSPHKNQESRSHQSSSEVFALDSCCSESWL